jgi:UPF0755 protein
VKPDPSAREGRRTDAERERDRIARELRRAPSPAQAAKRRRVAVRVLWGLALLAAAVVVWFAVGRLSESHRAKTVAAPIVARILVPEGDTRRQIALRAQAAKLTGGYLKVSERSSLLNPVAYGAPRDTPDLEGFLFPATYEVYAGSPAVRLVDEQLAAFRENFGRHEIARAHALHITPYQLLIVASMIEREALLPGDRAKIAAVVYNRLRLGMPLGIDATIYYALGQRAGSVGVPSQLTEADLHIDSPYNTRTHTGLPPTPISNPGAAAIDAAAHPAHASYLYYVNAPNGCGALVFSNTAAQFEAHAAAYQAAVARNGGRPPTCARKP